MIENYKLLKIAQSFSKNGDFLSCALMNSQTRAYFLKCDWLVSGPPQTSGPSLEEVELDIDTKALDQMLEE